jgi:hypothetical protein
LCGFGGNLFILNDGQERRDEKERGDEEGRQSEQVSHG